VTPRQQRHAAGRLARTGFAIWAAVLAHPAPAAGADVLRYAVEAAYLSKFGAFFEWPAGAFASPSSAVNLCVAGADPFGASLDATAAGQQIGGRPIVVRHLAAVPRGADCHILFVGGADPRAIAQVLNTVRGAGVVTVTDAASSGATPSIIRFVVRDDRVRFVIASRPASLNGIVISSKLLSLALPDRN
jgi:hypothetical protein